MGNSRTHTPTHTARTKTTCVTPEALRLLDDYARDLRRGRGGRQNRSRALAALIDSFKHKGEAIKHSWTYEPGKAGGDLRKVNFEVTPDRLEVLKGIRKALSEFEGGDVGLGFTMITLIMEQLGPKTESVGPKVESVVPKPAKARRVA